MEALSQIIAVIIFAAVFVAIIVGKVHRYIPALIGAGLVVILFLAVMRSPQALISTLNLAQLGQLDFWIPLKKHVESHGINWQTVIFIAGMMTMIEGLAAVGFFRWLCLFVAKLVHYRVVPLLVAFTLLSGFMAMFIDSITVLLFLATVTVELSRLLKFDPVPMIIAEIFAANTGGSATMAGDPPNVIIGTSFGYNFTDFLVNTGPIAWAGMLASVVFFYFIFRKHLSAPQSGNSLSSVNHYPEPGEAIANRNSFIINAGILLLVVVLLLTHAQTGISVASIGVIAILTTLIAATNGALNVIKRIDWRTLLFFIGLFVCVGALENTGVLNSMAVWVKSVSRGNFILVMTAILWFSAFASAIVDNIPFAAAMVPVVRDLSVSAGFSLPALSWALALGTDIGGNGTPIGASANVVGTAIAQKEGYPIGWGRYMKYAMPAMIGVVGICQLLLMIRYT